jgi:phosphatidylglycerol lysyltransferase
MKKVLKWAGLVFFVMAVVAVYSQLSKYSLSEIKDALLSIPVENIGYAALACIAGYLVLSCYDFVALKYIGKRLSVWKWMLAGLLGFAITNNAGTAIVSGAAIRYRLYTRWRIHMPDIFKMILFSGVTYLIGCMISIVIGYFLIPPELMHTAVVKFAFWPCLAIIVFYFSVALFFTKAHKEAHVGHKHFKMPRPKVVAMQCFVGTFDAFFASLVLYAVLYPLMPVSFAAHLGAYVIAQALGVFTPVPGALGVFEGLYIFLLPGAEENAAVVFGALIAYRIIYFLIPLIFAGITMFILPKLLKLAKHNGSDSRISSVGRKA